MNIIAIGPGQGFLGSNSTLFQFQATDDIYFCNYFGPSQAHGIQGWGGRHIRVHVECSEFGWHFITLQSNIQGGLAYSICKLFSKITLTKCTAGHLRRVLFLRGNYLFMTMDLTKDLLIRSGFPIRHPFWTFSLI